MKKTLSMLLALILSLSLLAMPASAANDDLLIMSAPSASTATHQSTAEALKYLGLFRGSDKGFELDRAPTRMEAIIMLIRLMGKESEIYSEEIFSGEVCHPFTDAPTWQDASNYLTYAYTAGLTNGKTATTFVPNEPASQREVVTMTLRALGYGDTEEGKLWDIWAEKADAIGLTVEANADFTRGDAVMLYWDALYCELNGSEQLLHESLSENWVIAPESMAVAEQLRSNNIDLEKSDLDAILAALYTKVPTSYFSIAHMPLTAEDPDGLAWYIGSSDIAFEEGMAAEPMMMAQAHSVVLVRLEDAEDAEDVMNTMKETVNPNKWICVGVEPENVKTAAVGDLVLLVLDNNHSQAFVDAFLSMAK